jgi:hypothetical protein
MDTENTRSCPHHRLRGPPAKSGDGGDGGDDPDACECRTSLKAVWHSAVEPGCDGPGAQGEHKAVKERCRSGTQDASFFPNISCDSSSSPSHSASGGPYSRGTSS